MLPHVRPARALRAVSPSLRDASIRCLSSTHKASSSPSRYEPENFTRATPSPSSASASENDASIYANVRPSPRPSYAHPPARHFKVVEIPGSRLTAWTWIKSLFGWRPTPTYKPAPFRAINNPYRARKKWPPDFSELDPKQQFHFEKTYRRRAALKWARPTWNKSIKILQHTLIAFTLIYFVFILEPTHGEGTPFDGFRAWFFEKVGKIGQLPEATREEAERLREEARQKMVAPADDNSPKQP